MTTQLELMEGGGGEAVVLVKTTAQPGFESRLHGINDDDSYGESDE